MQTIKDILATETLVDLEGQKGRESESSRERESKGAGKTNAFGVPCSIIFSPPTGAAVLNLKNMLRFS